MSHHQTRFKEGLNRQYSPNYINPYQSTLGSTPGQNLSATLIELANIKSRSLEMMAASQRSQQEAFQELTRVSKDKSNDSMFTAIKTFDGTILFFARSLAATTGGTNTRNATFKIVHSALLHRESSAI